MDPLEVITEPRPQRSPRTSKANGKRIALFDLNELADHTLPPGWIPFSAQGSIVYAYKA